MKKNTTQIKNIRNVVAFSFISAFSFGQVGIGNTNPKSSLDVTGVPTSATTADGITAPRLSRANLIAKTAYNGTDHRGTIVYVTDLTGTTNAQTVNVTQVGYYYLDNNGVWQRFVTGNSMGNIYNTDGTLTGDRTISTGAYSLTIDGGTPTYDKVNMANGVFSLDDVNDRIGIKTTTPTSTLDVAGNPSSPSQVDGITAPRLTRAQLSAKTGYSGLNNRGAMVYVTDASGTTNAQTINVQSIGYYYLDNNGVWQKFENRNIYTQDGTLTGNRTINTSTYGLSIVGAPTVDQINMANGVFSLDDINDRIGILTTAPKSTLDVAGNPSSPSQVDGITAPRLTRANLIAKTGYTGANNKGAIVYVTDLSGTTNAQTINVTQIGYYYLDNSGVWQRFVTDNSIENIYTSDGNLTGDRTINTGGYKLNIASGTPLIDKVNIANGLFSVDDVNDRIGIKTTTPTTTLDVVGFASSISQADGIRAPRLTRANLSAKTVYTGANHRGAIVYVTDLSGTTNAQTINVTQIGYYYLDNSGIWQRFVTDNSIENIYTSNGSLTSNRTISTGAYRLSINSGSPMLDMVNMDNGTFSLDALNNRIGIGTTSPTAKLHVLDASSNNNHVFKASNNTTTLDIEIRNQFSPATMGSGAVNYSANGENVFCVFDLQGVQGNLIFGEHLGPYNSGDYDIGRSYGRWRTIYLTNSPNVSSDKRLKSNLKPISNATNLIMSLTPLNYDKYKTFEKTGEFVNEFGFIAQDLKKVVPQAVTGNENDENPMGVQYEMLIPILTKAIQEQQEVISSLEMRIKALEESKK